MSQYQVRWVDHTQGLHDDIIEAVDSDAAIAEWNLRAKSDTNRWVISSITQVE